jgi:hypothetical protein
MGKGLGRGARIGRVEGIQCLSCTGRGLVPRQRGAPRQEKGRAGGGGGRMNVNKNLTFN